MSRAKRVQKKESPYPIEHWSFSSLMSFLRNPLAWHKRYVEHVYDMPTGPAAVIGRAGHTALEFFYSQVSECCESAKARNFHSRVNTENNTCPKNILDRCYREVDKEQAKMVGLESLRAVSDFEINFGVTTSDRAKKAKRLAMEKEYLQAVSFYLKRAPRHQVLGVEVSSIAHVEGIPLPIKAISDLVVQSPVDQNALDIVDHKFVDSFSVEGPEKPLFILQAIFNYYTVTEEYNMPVRRFIFQECKKRKNRDGKSQMRKHVIDFSEHAEDFELFHRLLRDATAEIGRERAYLPNPSDMFEGKNSFEIYRLDLLGE